MNGVQESLAHEVNHPEGSHLLVKAEWDKAETWLQTEEREGRIGE